MIELEQYTRKNNIELNGVVETPQEDVEEICCAVAKVIGVQLAKEDIEAAHRIPTRRSDVPNPIVVQ